MNIEATLSDHLKLCESIHTLLLEENRILKNTQSIPNQTFIEKKKHLLPILDKSLEAIKKLQPELASPFGNVKDLLKSAQNKLLQILYLDRENEELIVKFSLETSSTNTLRSISPTEVKSIFNEVNKKESSVTK